MSELNLVDALLAAIVLLAAWTGWRRGFVSATIDLLALACAVLAALWAWPSAAARLVPAVDIVWARPLAFVGVFALVRVALGLLLGHAVARVPPHVQAHPINRAAGLLPGAAGGLLDATIAVLVLLSLPLSAGFDRAVRDSALAARLAAPAERIEAALTPVFDEAARAALDRLTVEPGSSERIDLPFSVQDPRQRPELEARMLELVNAERARAGLAALAPDPALAEVARAHSRDMFGRGYFSHHSPEGADAFDRLKRAGVRYRLAGENLALAPRLEQAHRGLMESPGHRANILRPGFRRAGIGILDGGRRGLMVTQVMAG